MAQGTTRSADADREESPALQEPAGPNGDGSGSPAATPRAMGPAGGRRPPLRRTFSAFRYPHYRLLWASMAMAMVGMQMQMIARGLLAYELAGNYSAVGALAAAWGIPQFFLALPGGAIADRMDKRLVLLFTQGAVFFQALAVGLLIAFDAISLQLLFAFGVVLGGTFSFNMPARQAYIPELVPRDELMNAIALNNTAMNATRLFSPVAAGIFIAAFGFATTYLITAAMYLVAWGAVWLLPRGRGHLAGVAERKGMFEEIRLGLRYVRGNRALRTLMLMALVPITVGMPFITILPAFASGDLGLDSLGFGLLTAVNAVGALAGSLLIAALNPSGRLAHRQALLGMGWGVGLIVLGIGSLTFGVPGAFLAMLVIGSCSMAYMALNNGMIMTSSSQQYHGRIMSLYMLTFGIFPLVGLPLGILGDAIGGYATFTLLGGAILSFMVLLLLLVPSDLIDRAASAGPGEAAEVEAPAG
ncbi:MAG: MFS transporter [Chloroflexi bacterium]|nr:MFS transporter [Chloroflexota bacterium]